MYKPHPREKRAFGSVVEQAAARFLIHHGLSLVCHSFSCRVGEIDLIMREEDVFVFVEVRYRRSPSHGTAAATVTWHKQRRIIHTAQVFLGSRGLTDRHVCRFDVVGISPHTVTDRLQFDWIRDAFSGA